MTQEPLNGGEELVQVVGFADLMASVVARRRFVAILSVVGLIVGVVTAILLPPRYTAESRIVGVAGSRTSLLSGLAGLAGVAGMAGDLGISLGGSSAQMSPEFYVDLLQSREIRETLLETPFPVDGDSTRRRRLIDQLGIRGRTEALRLYKGLRYLERRTSVEATDKSGIVDVKLALPEPRLAAAATNRLIALLNEFNLTRLQFQSRQQRVFAEGRLHEAEAELRAAEQDQLAFAERNRSISNSPALQVEAARLQRVVDAKQVVYTTLTRAYEEARIAEAKDIPTLTVIDRAEPPARRSQPRPWLIVLIGLVGGALLGIGGAIAWDMIQRARASVAHVVHRGGE